MQHAKYLRKFDLYEKFVYLFFYISKVYVHLPYETITVNSIS